MSFTDLDSIAGQYNPQNDPRNDPVRLPPDPRSFAPLGPTNPVPLTLASLGQPEGSTSQPPPPAAPDEDTTDLSDSQGWWRDTQHDGSNYFPPAAAKGYDEWGKRPLVEDMDSSLNESPGPFVPSMQQSWGVINGAGRNLSRWSAPSVAGPAGSAAMIAGQFAPLLDIISAGAFSRKFNAAQMQRQKFELEKQLMTLKIQQEQMVQQAELAIRNHDQMMVDFSKIFFEADQGIITPQEAESRVRQLAMTKYQHDNLNEVLKAKGLKGVEDYLNNEHAYITALAGATSAQRKELGDSEDEILKSWNEKPSGKGKGLLDFPNLPGRGGEKPATIPDVTPAPRELPKTAEEYGDNLSKELGLTQREFEAAQSLLRGEEPEGWDQLKSPKSPGIAALKAKIEKAADRMHSDAIRAAANKDPTLSPEQKLQQLDKIDPVFADKLRGISRYELDPDKLATLKNRGQIESLVKAINPNWSSGKYKIVQKYADPSSSNVAGRVLESVSGFNTGMFALSSALLHVPEDRKIPAAVIDKLVANAWDGDPTYTQIYTSIQEILSENQTIQSRGLKPSVQLIREQAKHLMETQSPAQIRASLQSMAMTSYGIAREYQHEFRREMGDPNAEMPFFPKSTEDAYKAYLRMNPYTGVFDKDAPDSLKGVSRPQGRRPSWLKKGGPYDWEPLTETQVRTLRDNLHDPALRNSPEQAVQEGLQKIRRRLGIFADEE